MDQFDILGGKKLRGKVEISGSKNASLPCLFATLLTDDPCELRRVPDLADIDTSIKLLTILGKDVVRERNGMIIKKGRQLTGRAPYELVRRMRASVLVMGPLLARLGKAHVSLPGGCAIGARPINFHLEGFKQMGVKIKIIRGYVHASSPGLQGAVIQHPYPSVGATENLMMAAVLAKGTTIIKNAAREPEIVDLGRLLQKMGARIEGLGTSKIKITGVKKLHGALHVIVPDRIETGTFLIAAAITKGDIILTHTDPSLLSTVIETLKKAGLQITEKGSQIQAKWVQDLRPVSLATAVYPGFPTDMQAQWMALMSVIRGRSWVKETVFENRFLHVQELLRFGANIQLDGRSASIQGIDRLSGCTAMVSDLRAGAALVLAGLAAQGKSTILRIYHLDRGYEQLEKKLQELGAVINRVNPAKRKS
ncbi:MAG: UDP-N-acetylglucosamine 1-carboxyvinyltransferase [Elusimicrobia bacterium]|nr:UDP-N-acetylglucosamine 1-carboxyvinyltransferase [Candidatus Obscuribacterium magneticum]